MPGYIDENGNYVATMGWVVAPFSGSWWKRFISTDVIAAVEDIIIPDFGLFGGSGFTGGHLFNSNNECIDGSGTKIGDALSIPPAKNSSGEISKSDLAFKAHDKAYYDAEIAAKADPLVNEAWRKLQADAALLQALYNVFTDSNYTMDKVEIAYDLLAANAFLAQIVAFDLVATSVEGFTDTAVNALKETAQSLFDSITTTSEKYTVDHLTLLTDLTSNNGDQNSDKNDILIGTSASERIKGLTGSDIIYGDAGSDEIFVVDYGLMKDLIAAGETDPAISGRGELATGGTGDDFVYGDDAADLLFGGEGMDLLVGGAGNDVIYGDSTFSDATQGWSATVTGTGEVTGENFSGLVFTESESVGDDVIYAGAGDDFVEAEMGDDEIYSGIGNDTVYGDGGNDFIEGGTGADNMIGGSGNDTYIVDKLPSGLFNLIPGDTVTEYCNDGIDTVESSVTYTLGSNVENLTLTGNSEIDATGNSLNNVLTGNSAVNTLTGCSGNDILEGGQGNDILIGGSGSDTYLLLKADGKDTINETAGISGDVDTLKLTDAVTTEPVIVKQGNDLYVFTDANNYVKIASEFQATNYGIERLEVSDGHYITRNDIQTIIDTMSAINDSGMDVLQKYNAMMESEQYQNILAASWQQ